MKLYIYIYTVIFRCVGLCLGREFVYRCVVLVLVTASQARCVPIPPIEWCGWSGVIAEHTESSDRFFQVHFLRRGSLRRTDLQPYVFQNGNIF